MLILNYESGMAVVTFSLYIYKLNNIIDTVSFLLSGFTSISKINIDKMLKMIKWYLFEVNNAWFIEMCGPKQKVYSKYFNANIIWHDTP